MNNPYLNALLAFTYISSVATVINVLASQTTDAELGIFAPIIFLTLLVLSVLVMGLLFFYRPFRLYFEGEKDAALPFLLKTIATFAIVFLLALAFVLFL